MEITLAGKILWFPTFQKAIIRPALEDRHCPLSAFLPHGVSASGQSPETHAFLFHSDIFCYSSSLCVVVYRHAERKRAV
jgi:hypothetical protein